MYMYVYVYGGRRRLDEGEEEGGCGRGWEEERLSEGLGEQEGGGKLKIGGNGEGRMKGTNTPVAVPSNENNFIMNHNHSYIHMYRLKYIHMYRLCSQALSGMYPPPLSPQALSGEVSPFMCSGSHVTQMDSHPSAIGAFLEGVLRCQPQPPVRSCVLKVKGGRREEGEEGEEEGRRREGKDTCKLMGKRLGHIVWRQEEI